MAVYSNSITLASVSDGQSGATLYTWIRYSNGAASNPSVTDTVQSDTKQIGFAYNKTSAIASSNYGDYEWSDYIGTSGDDGVGVVSIVEEYYLSTSSTQQTGGSWKTTPDPWVSGKYYWTRSTITWTDNKVGENPTHTDPVLAQGLNSANSTASSASSTASQTSTALTNYMTQTDATLGSLQNQIDGQVEVWYFEVDPGTATDPSSSWTTDEEKARHIGDLYYNVDNGHSWRWLDQGAGENPRYIWQQIPDSDAAAALATAQAAQTTANTKRRVFTSTPFVPYDVGDLWVSGNTVKYCQTAKTSGQSYSESDWVLTATDDTNALTQVDVYYAINTSESTPPAGYDNPSASANWSTTPPTWEDGKYIWSVTVTYKGGQAQTPTDPVNITGAKGETGAAAPYIILTGPTNVIAYDRQTSTYTPNSSFTVTGTATNTSISSWTYSVNGGSYSSTLPAGLARNGNTITITPNNFTNKTVAIKATGGTVSDVYTITRIESGKNGTDGAPGNDAIEVILSNESHTLTANASGAISSYTGAYTDVQIFEGITDKSSSYSIKVNNVASGSTTINGITVTVGTRKVTVTAVASGFTNNVVPIDIYNSGGNKIATKNFTISVSKAGAGINTVTITYGYSTSGTDASTVTNWGSSIPSVPQGQFLWTRTVTTYTDGSASKTTYSVSRIGEDGIDGDLYRVDTNYQEVYRTYSVDETTGNEEINYSPTTLTFKVYKEDTLQICNTNYKYDVSILYNSTDAGGGTTVDTEYIYTFLTQLTGTQPFTLSNNNQTISFNIENFMTLTSSNSTNKTRIENIQRLVREANVFFVITILDSSSTVGTVNTYKILTKHVFSVTNLVTSSLESFSVTADSINAAVRDAKMQFTADGLEITNGSFLIKNNQGQEVFSYVPDAENLYVKGRIEADAGYFNGELRAATGTFAGDISAARGTFKGDIEVGGNSVFGGRLEAASGTFKGELTAATGNFNGTITANEGWIGGFKIGSTALYANVPSGATTTTSQLVLDSATPSIKLGSLTFNGNTSTIHGNSFDISPDLAEFKNINISGKISASVFEVGKTQAVGGSMIFKPSFKVESFTNNTLTISEGSLTDFLSTSLYVAVIDETGESIISHVKPSSVTSSTATFSGTPFSGKRPISLIVLGNDGDIIIGINSYNSNSILLGRGLTIREYDHTDTSGRTQPKLFLGDLNYNSSIIQNGVSGYGLYADNVVLNGSLTTIIGSATSANHTYAGVNTLSPIQAIKFEDDDSNIVFWAGSAGTQAQDIAGILDDNNYPGAPFQVTEKGSLYARQGTFEGAIITRSTIQGVDIYGARIHGTGNNPGLGIYNTSNSITFYRGDYGNNPEETFSIGPNGLQFSGSYFINVGGTGNIDFTGDSFVGNNFTASTFIQGQTLIANDDTNTNTITGTRITNSNTSYIEFSNTMNFNIKNSTISQLQLEETRGVFNTNDLVTQKNLQIGNNSGSAMRFMQVSGGYDLYIA